MGRGPCTFRQSDVARLVRGVIAGGMTPGTFQVQLMADGRPAVVPIDVAPSRTEADALEQRMQDAFGE